MLLLVDGTNVLWRSAHSRHSQELARPSDGAPTGVALTFMRTILNACQRHQPKSGVVVFDGPGPGFRQLLNPSYKGMREHVMPNQGREQIDFMRRAVWCLGLQLADSEPYEADDILATLAAREPGNAIILSDDKDLGTLVRGSRIVQHRMCDAKHKSEAPLLDSVAVKKRWGVAPHLLSDLQALSGDMVDNVQGIDGVGKISARDLIRTHGSVEHVALAAGKEIGKRWKSRAGGFTEIVRMASMTRLIDDVNIDLEIVRRAPDWPRRVVAFFLALEAFSSASAFARKNRIDVKRISPDPKISSKSRLSTKPKKSILFG